MITPRVMLITPSYSNGYYVLSFLGHDYQVAIRNEVAETVLYCGCVSNPIGTLIRVSASEKVDGPTMKIGPSILSLPGAPRDA
jgi:hypothetical protein